MAHLRAEVGVTTVSCLLMLVGVLLIIASLCARLARAHREVAWHCRTIEQMLDHLDSPHPAYLVAYNRRPEIMRERDYLETL
jgi:hypothetical protein